MLGYIQRGGTPLRRATAWLAIQAGRRIAVDLLRDGIAADLAVGVRG